MKLLAAISIRLIPLTVRWIRSNSDMKRIQNGKNTRPKFCAAETAVQSRETITMPDATSKSARVAMANF